MKSIVDLTDQESSVVNQLFCKKRLEKQNGYWAESFLDFDFGSYLWTLDRAFLNSDTQKEAERIVREALNPLIEQGLSPSFEISQGESCLKFKIEIDEQKIWEGEIG